MATISSTSQVLFSQNNTQSDSGDTFKIRKVAAVDTATVNTFGESFILIDDDYREVTVFRNLTSDWGVLVSPDDDACLGSLAKFPGGNEGLSGYLARIAEPEEAQSIEGAVRIRFAIDETGKVTDVVALTKASSVLIKTAIEYISNMPAWMPAVCDGKRTKTFYEVPLFFKKD